MKMLQDGSRQHQVSRCLAFRQILRSSYNTKHCEEKMTVLILRAGKVSLNGMEELFLNSGMALWKLQRLCNQNAP